MFSLCCVVRDIAVRVSRMDFYCRAISMYIFVRCGPIEMFKYAGILIG